MLYLKLKKINLIYSCCCVKYRKYFFECVRVNFPVWKKLAQ
jgi:hypothetical protein